MQHKIYIQGFVETDPFFYIIHHKLTGMLYAGYKEDQNSKGRKSCNSKTFMTEDGYQTTSREIKGLINLHGLDSFEVVRIRHFSSGKEAYAYETRFLRKVKAKRNPRFHNKSNNKSLVNEFNNKGMIRYHRGESKKMFYPGEVIPEGWIKGSPHKMGECGKGKVYYHNGKISRRFFEGEEPEGWIKGNLGVKGEKNGCFGKKGSNSGNKRYTNGIDMCYVTDGDIIPEGFYLGTSDSFLQMLSDYSKGSNNPRFGSRGEKWFNNGSINKLCVPGEEPMGFNRGMMKKNI